MLSRREYVPYWIVGAVAFFVGAASDILGLWEQANSHFFGERPPEPQVIARYLAFPDENLFDEKAQAAISGAILRNQISDQEQLSSEEIAKVTKLGNDFLGEFEDCNGMAVDEACEYFYHSVPHIVGLILRNDGGSPITSGKLFFDNFSLDRSFRKITHFSVNYTEIVDGCLYSFPERPCTLKVGEVKPQTIEVSVPDIPKGGSVFVPMFRVAFPEGEAGSDFWVQYQWGELLLPTKFEYTFGNGFHGEMIPRDMLENVFEVKGIAFGLG